MRAMRFRNSTPKKKAKNGNGRPFNPADIPDRQVHQALASQVPGILPFAIENAVRRLTDPRGASYTMMHTANGSKHVTLYKLSESVLYAIKTSLILTLNVGILDEGNLRARVVEAIELKADELERETGIEIRR